MIMLLIGTTHFLLQNLLTIVLLIKLLVIDPLRLLLVCNLESPLIRLLCLQVQDQVLNLKPLPVIWLWFVFNLRNFLWRLQETTFQECWSQQDCDEDRPQCLSLSYCQTWALVTCLCQRFNSVSRSLKSWWAWGTGYCLIAPNSLT